MVKYVIRPSKRQELLELINSNYEGNKRSRGRVLVINNRPMTFTRWANWFDLNTLDNALMEEGYEEVVVDNEKYFDEEVSSEDIEKSMELDMENLGI